MIGTKFRPRRSVHSFRFGSDVQMSLGTIPIRIPTGHDTFLKLFVDVVPIDVPFLLGLDVLKREQIYPNTVDNKLVCKSQNWEVDLRLKFGHMYYDWSQTPIMFTRKELVRFHKHFFHPSSSKLFDLIKRAKPDEAHAETRKTLEDISRVCKTCQHLNHKTHRFRVSMPKDCVFNEELALDLVFLDGSAALHVVDTRTHFSAAVFLTSQSVDGVWDAFITAWATVYTGYPNVIRADQGSIFTSPRWKKLMDATGITLQLSGIESHNSIGAGERYHAPLRRIYHKIIFDFPQLNKDIALNFAVKAMNDTMGPEGLVPSLLVFGVLPRFPASSNDLPNQEDRMRALTAARAEMESISCQLKLQHAMLSKLPPACDLTLAVGDKVLISREKSTVAQGPFEIVEVDGKQVYVLDDKGVRKQFSLAQVHPYYENPNETCFANLHDVLVNFASDASHPNDVTNSCSASPPDANSGKWTSHTLEGNGHSNIHLTQDIPSRDSRASSNAAIEAKRKEIAGLISRNTWKIVCETDLPRDANVLGGRFILTLKEAGTEKEFYKARYVVQGHRDKEKAFLVHNSTTLQQQSTKLILSLAAVFGFRIWNQDVTQAYTQSALKLMRTIFLRPPRESHERRAIF